LIAVTNSVAIRNLPVVKRPCEWDVASGEPGFGPFPTSSAWQLPFVLKRHPFILNLGPEGRRSRNPICGHSGGRCLARGVQFDLAGEGSQTRLGNSTERSL
jgi:hypothetical protein